MPKVTGWGEAQGMALERISSDTAWFLLDLRMDSNITVRPIGNSFKTVFKLMHFIYRGGALVHRPCKSSSFAVWDLGIELGLLCFGGKCLYLMNHLTSPHDWFLMNVKLEKRCCV